MLKIILLAYLQDSRLGCRMGTAYVHMLPADVVFLIERRGGKDRHEMDRVIISAAGGLCWDPIVAGWLWKMKRKILAGLTIGLFMFVMVGMAQAATFQVSFEVSSFFPATDPAVTVTGTIWYEAANAIGPIEAITQVDLSIASYSYARSEVAFATTGPSQVFGGTPGGAYALEVNDNDFWLAWVLASGVPSGFFYTVQDGGRAWVAAGFDHFSIVEQAAVPIPGAVYLFGSGLIGLAGFRRKFKKQ